VEVKKGAEKDEKCTVTLIGGRGDTFHNGRRLRKQEQVMTMLAVGSIQEG